MTESKIRTLFFHGIMFSMEFDILRGRPFHLVSSLVEWSPLSSAGRWSNFHALMISLSGWWPSTLLHHSLSYNARYQSLIRVEQANQLAIFQSKMSSGEEIPKLSAGELRARFVEGQEPGVHFVLVDLRGSDFQGGTIKGSLNIPITSLPSAIPTLASMCLSAKISDVIFFCGWWPFTLRSYAASENLIPVLRILLWPWTQGRYPVYRSHTYKNHFVKIWMRWKTSEGIGPHWRR